MSSEAFELAQAVLLAVGGGAAIVFVLSSWLGKLWARRILQNEKLEHDRELSLFKQNLEQAAHKQSLNYKEKIDLYKLVTQPLVEFLALVTRTGLTQEHLDDFDRQRLHMTAQLALFASQNVFDAFNEIIDYIYDSSEKGEFSFHDFRVKGLEFLSEMRKDIGIYSDDVTYNGSR